MGEATCGILYLAGYLRRNGIEAFVRLFDGDTSDEMLQDSLQKIISAVRPRVVGVSLKWCHHLYRARRIAEMLRNIDPTIEIVMGGDTVSYYWQELLAWPSVYFLIKGDGELPVLSLCPGQ